MFNLLNITPRYQVVHICALKRVMCGSYIDTTDSGRQEHRTVSTENNERKKERKKDILTSSKARTMRERERDITLERHREQNTETLFQNNLIY